MSQSQALQRQAVDPDEIDRASPPLVAVTTSLSPPIRRIVLWDLPLRIFHWSLLASVSTAIATGILGGEWMPVHGKAGLTIAGLLAFRVVWGFIGSTHARFASFLPTPTTVLNYLRGRWQGAGHNPLGALSVLALLSLLAIQVGTGLIGNDEIAFTGPLASLVDESLSVRLTGLHHQLAKGLYALLGLHVAAIAFYTHVKKQRLITPMVTGWKDVGEQVPAPRRAGPLAFLVAAAVAAGIVYLGSGAWITTGHESATPAASAPTTSGRSAAPAW